MLGAALAHPRQLPGGYGRGSSSVRFPMISDTRASAVEVLGGRTMRLSILGGTGALWLLPDRRRPGGGNSLYGGSGMRERRRTASTPEEWLERTVAERGFGLSLAAVQSRVRWDAVRRAVPAVADQHSASGSSRREAEVGRLDHRSPGWQSPSAQNAVLNPAQSPSGALFARGVAVVRDATTRQRLKR